MNNVVLEKNLENARKIGISSLEQPQQEKPFWYHNQTIIQPNFFLKIY